MMMMRERGGRGVEFLLKYWFLALIYCSCKTLVVPSLLAAFVTRTTLVVIC